jgi:GT2 family glycosyltransferase/glycosyltransferase involved in cell wall biosynthesis
MNETNLLDIIIVNYNSTDFLLSCLRSIFDGIQSRSYVKVFVIDNASKDNVSRVITMFPQVILTKNDRNLGFAEAINRGIEQGSAPYVLVINPDTVLSKGFCESVVGYMEDHLDVGILGPRIFDQDGSIQGSARSFPTPLTALFGRKSLLTRFFPDNPITRENILTISSDGITPMEVDWVSGACMVARRKAIDDAGPMDTQFFMYWEDADWCRRMWWKGWKVVYYPKTTVIHYVGASSQKNLFRSVLSFHTSIYRLFKKYVKTPHSLLKPLVFWGLIFRFLFVLGSKTASKGFTFLKSRPGYAKIVYVLPSDHKIRVVRFIARLNIGGPSIHVYLLTKGLDKNIFHSTLVTGKISPQEGDMSYLFDSLENKPVIIRELQREISPPMDVKSFFRIFKILLHESPDIIHTHTAKAGTSARIAVLMYNLILGKHTHLIHTFHGHVFEGYFSRNKSILFIWIERFLAKITDVIVAISETQKKELSEKFRIAPPAKFRTIQLGFDLRPFMESETLKGSFRQALGLNDDALLIGIIGRLVPIKNHFMFLQAVRLFLEESPATNARFVVVGDGELRDELEEYSVKQGLSDYVIFCGWMKDLPMVYADIDVLALTSLNEGTPVSIIEAMAASIPVIATNAGGVLDLLGPRDGTPPSNVFMVCDRGVLCRKGDTYGFAKGLKYLTDMDTHEREELTERARAFVAQRFSEERLLKDMETLYLELMGRSKGTQVFQRVTTQVDRLKAEGF